MFNLFNRKKLSSEFVELALTGPIKEKIYLYELTNGLVNQCLSVSTIYGEVLNINFLLQQFEYNLVPGGKKFVDNLSIENGDILRLKIRRLLQKHNIIKVDIVSTPTQQNNTETERVNLFNNSEIEWFNKEANAGLNRVKAKLN